MNIQTGVGEAWQEDEEGCVYTTEHVTLPNR